MPEIPKCDRGESCRVVQRPFPGQCHLVKGVLRPGDGSPFFWSWPESCESCCLTIDLCDSTNGSSRLKRCGTSTNDSFKRIRLATTRCPASERVGRIERVERVERAERVERVEGVERVKRSERTEPVERAVRVELKTDQK